VEEGGGWANGDIEEGAGRGGSPPPVGAPQPNGHSQLVHSPGRHGRLGLVATGQRGGINWEMERRFDPLDALQTLGKIKMCLAG